MAARAYLLSVGRATSPWYTLVPLEVHSLIAQEWVDPFLARWAVQTGLCRFNGQNVRTVVKFRTRTVDGAGAHNVSVWLDWDSNGYFVFLVEGAVPLSIAYNPWDTSPYVLEEEELQDIPAVPGGCVFFGNWRFLRTQEGGLVVRNTRAIRNERIDLLPNGTVRYAKVRRTALLLTPEGMHETPDLTGIDFAWDKALEARYPENYPGPCCEWKGHSLTSSPTLSQDV
eukprot:TRINITY_DN11698_c0_g1_i1.p2 TRINITY_DN11698_c0_g1~~TRINITY_DN11698_c0_g1_i1.p2  ORF type:complete len:239 (+),score=33.07 TRINITY_DN11698_c0_g1_i1:39-719(+)